MAAVVKAPRCAGLVQPDEGQHLAKLARYVPADQAIVEVGSHTGLSTCWLASGVARGHGAHITAVDPWADPRPSQGDGMNDDPFGLLTGDSVYGRFAQNIAAEGHGGRVTPLRTYSAIAAGIWVQPVGLLFVDALHEYEPVKADYLHWQRHIPVGGWIAFHDYTDDPTHPYYGVKRAVDELVIGPEWSEPTITRYLFTAQRVLTPE